MKKNFMFLLFCAILIAATFMACDNSTEPDNGNGNPPDTADVVAPYINFWSPGNGDVDVPVGATLYVSICDTGEHTTGIDPDSISIIVDGEAVIPAMITNLCGGIDLRHVPETAFEHGDTVTVMLSVTDMESNWLHDTITFFVELPWDTCTYNIDTLSPMPGFAIRSRPSGSVDQGLYFPNMTGLYRGMPGGAPYSLNITQGRSFILHDIGGNIGAINFDYSINMQLTNNALTEKYPALHPNGHILGFSRLGDVVLRNLFNGEEEVLSSTAQGGRDLEFSADSLYLAYRSGSGSMNPKLFVWRLEDRIDIANPTLYNDIDCFDWSPAGGGIAVISAEKLFYWDVNGGFPVQLHSGDNLKYVRFGPENTIFFVESLPTGDIIKSITTGGALTTIVDLTVGAATVEGLGISHDNEIVYAKNSGGSYSIEYFDIDAGTGNTVSSVVGQVRQVIWF